MFGANNAIGYTYWDIVEKRLIQQASGQPLLPAEYQ
jgi:hypothetical protein